MNEPIFDHEKLDVYRLSIEYVAFTRAMAEGNGKHSLMDRSRFLPLRADQLWRVQRFTTYGPLARRSTKTRIER